jgi:hypothetical protein
MTSHAVNDHAHPCNVHSGIIFLALVGRTVSRAARSGSPRAAVHPLGCSELRTFGASPVGRAYHHTGGDNGLARNSVCHSRRSAIITSEAFSILSLSRAKFNGSLARI